MSATGMTVILAALIGGGTGALGTVLLLNQRHNQIKQRFQQIRQEIDRLLQTHSTRAASDPKIFNTLERLNQTMQESLSQLRQEQKQGQKQLQGEAGVLRKELNQLRELVALPLLFRLKLLLSSSALMNFLSVS
jgi:gas vesicle protein